MHLQQDLSRLWLQTVAAGSIVNRFVAKDGQDIEIGLRLVKGQIEHYARYVHSGAAIGARIAERALPPGPFSIEWNQYRALKPHIRVTTPGRQPDIAPGVQDCHFGCERPRHPLTLLKREPLLQVALPHAKWVAFYNAVPVEPRGHFLWVPVRAEGSRLRYPHALQVLTEPFVLDFVALAEASTDTATLYNSLHAGASVNHIHFHSVHAARTRPLCEAAVETIHSFSFLAGYPATGVVMSYAEARDRLWRAIERMQRHGIPLNLVAVDGRVFLFPRNPAHEAVPEFPDGVMACAELSGKLITTREDTFQVVRWEQMEAAFQKTCLSNEATLRLLLG